MTMWSYTDYKLYTITNIMADNQVKPLKNKEAVDDFRVAGVVVVFGVKVALHAVTHAAQPSISLAPAKWSITHRMPNIHSRTQGGALASFAHASAAFATILEFVFTGWLFNTSHGIAFSWSQPLPTQ